MTNAQAGSARADLGMYPFEPLRGPVERLWHRLLEVVPELPAQVEWDIDLHRFWRDPDMVVSQTCGWPLVTELADLVDAGRIRVIGAFEPAIPEADGPTYRSVIVATAPAELADLVERRAAVNSTASLSGWVSLVHAAHGPGATWSGPVLLTGAHLDSIRALRDGRADVASIDSVSWAHAGRLYPELLAGLHVIGHGPRVPCLPLIAGPGATSIGLDRLRAGFVHALGGDAGDAIRSALLVERFHALDAADYAVLRGLAPAPQ